MKMLEGKIAIITGGSMGIGGATAELFAEHGAKLVITARRKDPLDEMVAKIRAAGGEVIGVVADASSCDDCERVFQTALDTYGDVDIVVNNAGMADLYPIDTTTNEEWDKVIAINQSSVFYSCRRAVQYMLEKNKGAIVNVSSTNGMRPLSGFAYSVSKHAVNALTQSVALRCSGTKVRCNAVCPGGTDTPMMANSYSAGVGLDPNIFAQMQKKIDLTLPNAQPIDQAWAIMFLASDYACSIQGAILAVDNGSFL